MSIGPQGDRLLWIRGSKRETKMVDRSGCPTSNLHRGGCLCGETRYEATGPSVFNVKCYCRDCQRITGTGHSPQLAYERNTFHYEGQLAVYESKSDSGNELSFHFCKSCGVCVCKFTTKLPDLVFIPAGTLDDPSVYADKHFAYESSRLDWDH